MSTSNCLHGVYDLYVLQRVLTSWSKQVVYINKSDATHMLKGKACVGIVAARFQMDPKFILKDFWRSIFFNAALVNVEYLVLERFKKNFDFVVVLSNDPLLTFNGR